MGKTDNLWTIILAGGKGTRMKSKDRNKVVLEVGGKPMIVRSVENLYQAGIKNIVIVVGFAKGSVMSVLSDKVRFAHQKKRLGTGHALRIGLEQIQDASNVMVLQGDDSYVYTPQILSDLVDLHINSHADMTFITLIVDNPTGLGRIVRDESGKVTGIVEEKDATIEQKNIKEINPACYIFSYGFLHKNINKIPKSPVTGEYYLTSLTGIAVRQGAIIETLTIEGLPWRGVNTPDELRKAQEMFVQE